MQLSHATAAAVVAGAVLATAGTAQASGGHRSTEVTHPVMRHAKISVVACRGRGGGFSTATFTAINRGDSKAFVDSWADSGHRAEIGSVRLAGGERGELGAYGTTGAIRQVEFHLVIRVGGVTRTKVVLGRDLPTC